MKDMKEILETLKDVMSLENEGKIFDKDLADALGMTSVNLATKKKRNQIPYAEISSFCAKRRIAINFILFSQSAESLVEKTDIYEMHHFGIAS